MTWFALFVGFVQVLAEALGLISKNQDRQAGAAIRDNEANANEIHRINAAADAGLNAGSLHIDTPDPFDEAGK